MWCVQILQIWLPWQHEVQILSIASALHLMRRKPPYVAINLLNKVTRMNKEGKKDTDSKRQQLLKMRSFLFSQYPVRGRFCEQLQLYTFMLMACWTVLRWIMIYDLNFDYMCRVWNMMLFVEHEYLLCIHVFWYVYGICFFMFCYV